MNLFFLPAELEAASRRPKPDDENGEVAALKKKLEFMEVGLNS